MWSTATWPPRNRLVSPLLATASAAAPAGAVAAVTGRHRACGPLRLRQGRAGHLDRAAAEWCQKAGGRGRVCVAAR